MQRRSDIFSYQYRYYSNVLETQEGIPDADSPAFAPLYLFNRRSFYLRSTGDYLQPLYYDASELHYGDADPLSSTYDSRTDYHVTEEYIEIRIPWSALNILDPVAKEALLDAYADTREGQSGTIRSIGIYAHYLGNDGRALIAGGSYRLPNLSGARYHIQYKQSYEILSKYWKKTS